jgi:ABC-type transporter Mla subunit MlaD
MMPGMPRVPGIGDVAKLMQAQSELLSELPSTVADLQRTVRGLSEALAATRETATSAQRVSARLEEILDEIEEPVRSLRPGIERLAVVLDDPVIDRIPAIIAMIEQIVTPIANGRQRLQSGTARLAERGRDLRHRMRR